MNIRTLDRKIIEWMSRYGTTFLRLSLGVVFLWFGFLKFFPDVSPAERLAAQTMLALFPASVSSRILISILAFWECAIGLGLITNVMMRTTLFLLFLQMLGTLIPLFLFPQQLFIRIPYAPTLEGQYIIKNLILISGGIVLGSTVQKSRTKNRFLS